jgi:hypothetical protein
LVFIFCTKFSSSKDFNAKKTKTKKTNDTNQPSAPPPPHSQVGGATPYSGVTDATFAFKFPVHVSRPIFLYGDEELLTQKPVNCTGPACAGISVSITFFFPIPK